MSRAEERFLVCFLAGLAAPFVAVLLWRLRAAERSARELRSRIGHAAPAWRRRDLDWFGARW